MIILEENKQAQDILDRRIELLEQRIAALTSQLDEKDKEISSLRAKLRSMKPRKEKKPKPPSTPIIQPELQKPVKSSYLISLLRQHFEVNDFMPGQEEAVNAILSGHDVFCSMPTISGMSICYRLPALLMPGLTLVIARSERDFPEHDAHSGTLSASLTAAQKRELFRNVKGGIIKMLCSTLEMLSSKEAVNTLRECDISMAVMLDDRLKDCSEFLDSLSSERIARSVFTHATSPQERSGMYNHLRSPVKVIAGFNRQNVSMSVILTDDKYSAIKDILQQKVDQPGVIYCSSPESVWRLREMLHNYGGIDDYITILPEILRRKVTRKDIRFIVNYDIPSSLADYADDIAPAGLDGSMSECIILVSHEELTGADESVVKYCSAKNQKDFLMSFLSEDHKPAPNVPDEFSDFDFGTANDAQKEAITSTNGPMLIIAGPGTGKTYTLVQRSVFLIQKQRAKPENIMLATFTDKAAQELTTRIAEALSSRNIIADTGSMYAGTFHVICARILREYSDSTGFDKTFRILDDFGHAYIIMQNFKDFAAIPGINSVFKNIGKWRRSCELRDYINKLSEQLIDPDDLMHDDDPAVSALGRAMKLHDQLLRDKGCMSCSSLLTETFKLLSYKPAVLRSLRQKIQYIMIDEYQDTNYIQEQLIFLLGAKSRNICVVGDDDQSLYRFRGATVRNILEFPDKWRKDECRIVRLMLNYRSTPSIVKFASQWMENTSEFFSWDNCRHAKSLEAYHPEPKYPSVMRLVGINDKEGWHEKILTFIKSLKSSGVLSDYNQIAFLFRSVRAKSVQELSQFLESNGINVYSPRSNLFFSRPEIRFAIGCLISMFPSYIDTMNSSQELDHVVYYRKCLQNLSRFIDRPSYSPLKRHIMQRRRSHQQLNDGYTNYTYSDLLYELFAFEPFAHTLDIRIDEGERALRPARNLSKLVQIFRDYELNYNVNNIKADYMPKQFQMMMDIYIRFRIDEGLDEYESDSEAVPLGYVAFMTIHQAKGREFPIVFIDSLWAKPDSELRQDWNHELMTNIETMYSTRPDFEPSDTIKFFDFWRMYYVAFTRAQNLLVLTCNENSNTPSRYLEAAYNRLQDTDDVFTPSEIDIDVQNSSEMLNTYSFTSDILTYELCPMQYKFFRKLEFPKSTSYNAFLGKLVHSTIEDINRTILNHEENKLTEAIITEWFEANYTRLSQNDLVWLSDASKASALAQVMRYVHYQGGTKSVISMAEAEVKLVRDKYILEGKIDLVSIRDGETEIIDFKSGTKPNMNIGTERERLEDCRRQVNVYAYLAVHALGLHVKRMKLYYTGEEGDTPEIVYIYDEAKAEEVIKGFDEIVNKLHALEFNERSNDPEACGECPFRHYCGKDQAQGD